MSASSLASTRVVDEIIVHCTATRPEWMWNAKPEVKVAEIDKWHKRNGWKGFGYHFFIDRDGTIVEGRHVNEVGAHTKGHNVGTLSVVLAGGFGSKETDKFEKNYTKEQDKALRLLLVELSEHNPTVNKISGHNQYAAKACPGFKVSKWMK